MKCGTKVTMAQFTKLFEDEPKLIQKLNRFMNKKQDELDPLVRFCPKKNCDGVAKSTSMNARSV